MKYLYKNSLILIIFIICFIGKDYLYNFIGNLNDLFLPKSNVLEMENEILKAENEALKKELDSYLELDLNDYLNYEYKKTKVILRDPYHFYRKGTILLGEDNNLTKNMIIVSEDGLVGVIDKVYNHHSEITLLTNMTNMSVKIKEAHGVLTSYKEEENLLEITKVANYENVAVGDVVKTSEYGKYPAGILIGEVVSINEDAYEIEQKIYVKPAADFNKLNHVAVILGVKP